MKNQVLFFFVFLNSIIFTNVAIAQNKPLACQGEAAAGFIWENGRWINSNFFTDKFILVQRGDTLTTDSVAKALGADHSASVFCKTSSTSKISCNDLVGGSLYFNPQNLKGGISQLFGSSISGAKRDTVSVQIFYCTPF